MSLAFLSFLAWFGTGLGLYLILGDNYLLFHALAELFSVAVACGSFFIAWNTRRLTENRFLSFLGTAFFFIALIDLLHTLSYKGMGVIPGATPNLPTEMWIGSRYLFSLSLLAGPSLARTRLTPEAVDLQYQ